MDCCTVIIIETQTHFVSVYVCAHTTAHTFLTDPHYLCLFVLLCVCLCCLLIPPWVLVIFRRRRPEEGTCACVFPLRMHTCDFLEIYSCRHLFPSSSSVYLFLSFSSVLLIQPCSFYSDSEFQSISPLLLFPHYLPILIKQFNEFKLISTKSSVSFYTVQCFTSQPYLMNSEDVYSQQTLGCHYRSVMAYLLISFITSESFKPQECKKLG